MVHEKNIDFLLRVLQRVKRQVPDILMLLAGEGPAEPHLKGLAQELDLQDNVHFIGNLQDIRDLVDCYAAGDVFVFASRTETQGLVLLEAMALGVPVVSTAKMGTVDILKPERGALVVEEDEAVFTGAVLQLLSDGLLRQRLGREGQQYASTWSASSMAMRLEDVYMETVESAFLFGREIGDSKGA
jgi:glycosyltransferase involved in cell wall biosynthesis